MRRCLKFLTECSTKVLSSFHPAGIPQDSVLRLFYLLYTAVIPSIENTIFGIFVDDTVILAFSAAQEKVTKTTKQHQLMDEILEDQIHANS